MLQKQIPNRLKRPKIAAFKYSSLLIGMISLILSFLILKQIKRKRLMINLSIIVLLVLLTYILDYNKTIWTIMGAIFAATIMNLIDYIYERNRN